MMSAPLQVENVEQVDDDDDAQLDITVSSKEEEPETDYSPSPDFEVPSCISIFFGLLCIILSVILYLMDIASNILMAYIFATNSHWAFFTLTLLFVFLPAVIMAACAGRLPVLQVIPKASTLGRILLLLLLAPVAQLLTVLKMGVKTILARENLSEMRIKYHLLVKEKARYAGIKLLYESFGAVFKPILQLYILFHLLNQPEGMRLNNNILYIQSIVVGICLLSISETLTRSERACRTFLYVLKGDKKMLLSWVGTILAFLMQLCEFITFNLPIGLLVSVNFLLCFAVMAYQCLLQILLRCAGFDKDLIQRTSASMGFLGIHDKDGPPEHVSIGKIIISRILFFSEYTVYMIGWFFLWEDQTSDSLNFRYAVIGGYYIVFVMGFLSVLLSLKFFHLSFNINDIRKQFNGPSMTQPEPTTA